MFFSATAARYSAILGDGLRTLASRQIDIKTSRPLRKIADRRSVLGALQKYGEVVTFNHVEPTQQDTAAHGRILAIFDTPEAASKAIDASPLSITLHHDENMKNNTIDQTTVMCEISTSEVDHYNDFIRTNPYHGPWDMDYVDKRIREVIKSGAKRHELADCFPGLKQRTLAAGQEETRDSDIEGGLREVSARSLAEILQQKVDKEDQLVEKPSRPNNS